ncbi:hypothetical protein DE146DRAFT_776267 [Phaeosphaeria sp. MPI-PUGE-AT-0046c]|nr:hypothetical protein DE146DRAFT_776267 [Phaeosphaeria sp. MPI-PUGE-AT-0046c]
MLGLNWQRIRDVGWIPWSLRLPILVTFVVIDTAIIACLVVLSTRSSSSDGFVTVGSQSVSVLNINWSLGLLWTTLPVLVFRLLGMYWEWITNPICERQPYVDLLKNGGAPAKNTVLLDYLAVPIFWRWCTALRNGHFLVSVCSLLTLVMSIVVSALSARLFAVRTVPITAEVPMLFNEAFNESSINYTVDWVPILDTVSAVTVHDGGLLGWTNDQYAFRPYQVPNSVLPGDEVIAQTEAYSANMNCSALSNYQLSLKDVRLTMTANDRGCDITTDFLVEDTQKVYFKTSSITTCSADAWFGRLVFVAAEYSSKSANKVDNVSVLSCVTNYRVSSGRLRTLFKAGSTVPTIQEFQATATDDTRLTQWIVFEQGLLSATAFNPKVTWSTSVFGNIVLYYARKLAGANYLSTGVLNRAISDIFSAAYLTSVAQNSFEPLSRPTTITGQISRMTERLYTVDSIVYIIVVILLLNMFTIVVAIMHVNTHATILEEQPSGLLAHAAILEKSPLLDDAVEMKVQNSKGVVEKASRGAFARTNWRAITGTDGVGWRLTRS